MRYERRDAQNQHCYAVFHENTGRRLGMVRRQLDGTWSADRATGPRAYLVHSGGHRTRGEAAQTLR